MHNKIKDITIIAIFAAILFVQEQLLTFLPNIQFTVFLLVLYSKVFGFTKTILICLIHVFLDNIVMSSFSLYYTPFMFIGWAVIPILVCFLFEKTENTIVLALVGTICSFIYSWSFLIPNAIFTEVNIFVYLANDLIFEIILACSSFLSILWLYKPCSKMLLKFVQKN